MRKLIGLIVAAVALVSVRAEAQGQTVYRNCAPGDYLCQRMRENMGIWDRGMAGIDESLYGMRRSFGYSGAYPGYDPYYWQYQQPMPQYGGYQQPYYPQYQQPYYGGGYQGQYGYPQYQQPYYGGYPQQYQQPYYGGGYYQPQYGGYQGQYGHGRRGWGRPISYGPTTSEAVASVAVYAVDELGRASSERGQRQLMERMLAQQQAQANYRQQAYDVAAGNYPSGSQPASTDPNWQPAGQYQPKGYRFVFHNMSNHDGVVVIVDERPADLNEDRRLNGDDDLNVGDSAEIVFYDGPDHTVRAYWWQDARAPIKGDPSGTPYKAMKEKVNLKLNVIREPNDVTVYEFVD